MGSSGLCWCPHVCAEPPGLRPLLPPSPVGRSVLTCAQKGQMPLGPPETYLLTPRNWDEPQGKAHAAKPTSPWLLLRPAGRTLAVFLVRRCDCHGAELVFCHLSSGERGGWAPEAARGE